MKAPASKAAKAGKSVASGASARAAKPAATARSASAKAAPKKAPAVKKPVAKAPAKPAVKAAARKAPAKPVATKAAAKPVAKAAAKKAVAKAPAKAPVKKAPAQAAVKPVAKAAAAPVKAVTSAAKAASAAKAVISKAKVASPPPPIVIEPSPPPMGKREARKVMLAQMSQPASVPSHAPDAAKATFSHMNERTVMTPPAPSSLQKDPKRANNWKTLPVEQLTDQDVQAMPDSEYMNDVQLAFFKLKLQRLRADMLNNAGETTEHLREDTVVVPDPADRATIEEEHALELRTRDRERKLLKKIEQALARIDAEDYGYCDETGEPIGVGRLIARPTASLSLEAQQRRELKQKMFGD
ncbi:MAG: RNA polymerase-binding protein DksA [Hydrogenophaga sp.]|uniref:RNA polymerase-binding protein DksA n=1 Tax=Hydrogenophaga sp. TaxID=1904254 RepID=UPI00169F9951|nr:RNA polymerase-binding protein DksA [Hydrogenophaga sp.]NIM43058.1 RNA polymerase-binding protein DksA [Hydrogenophaga sp.]NIN28126.1 RNA polymerase-binding protein DksA [Hydrogenophaga sp.]NIN30564.1 RNA polymerase-binding protein DksA [Hydrogenophaga sp.]NIN57261.1 RNA polymerase-binding protein DksA [Hydrogenophaga sp.]NIO51480.1 RNA polymerase-binding protein DksA [Hydrogenophaga sp.]